ncbi:hypothetical protein SAMN04489859_100985 [Paracoccus alcaliphilus]|uniref:Uncharacterized protein n=1 Tax=Paracoccus alcaliphilus TaxID=34002 RepID=A0A1H8HHP8_9RHOB|nr:hypothetical protein [Paracoccus alcaliphilus]SEN55564.1 hypothetical protein SAMN04489859_100985 [Paracoccus alcaliphilus]
MIRLCVLSNSHSAALKLAWDEMSADHPDIALTFFAARGGRIGKLQVRGDELVPLDDILADQIALTSGGKRSVRPNDYDAFLVYGYGKAQLKGGGAARFSSAFADRVTIERARKRLLSERLLIRLRKITDKPVFICPCPLPTQQDGKSAPRLKDYHDEMDLLQRVVFSPLSATLVPQPAETILDGSATRPEYGEGSVRLRVPGEGLAAHDSGERLHMNKEYGRVWLTHFLPLLTTIKDKYLLSAR